MAGSLDDVENYLIHLGRKYEKTDSTLLVSMSGGHLVAVQVIVPIVAIRVEIGPEPESDAKRLRFYRRLLELNASDLIHAAYGLEGGKIVLSGALALENLDANELESALSDVELALVRHTEELTHSARD
jgi:hypothetical protein